MDEKRAWCRKCTGKEALKSALILVAGIVGTILLSVLFRSLNWSGTFFALLLIAPIAVALSRIITRSRPALTRPEKFDDRDGGPGEGNEQG